MADRCFPPWGVFRSRTMRRVLGCAILLILAVAVFWVADAWVERPKKRPITAREPWEDDPAVVALLGRGCRVAGVGQVLEVDVLSPTVPFDDSDLQNLKGFKWLTTLNILSQKGIHGSGLRHIADLTNLNHIDLSGCSIDDRGVRYLEKLTKLTSLGLAECPITDDGLRSLAKLQDLHWLWLSRTRISDKGLAEIGSLVNLRELVLDGTSLTDAGLSHLVRLHELRQVSLDDTAITDAGLKNLQSLSDLETLSLQRTRVTGAGLRELQSLPKLKRLLLEGTTASLAEAREFRQTKQSVAIWLGTGLLHEDGRWEPRPRGRE